LSTLVFERRRAVGSVPSIQMYSALYATFVLCVSREPRQFEDHAPSTPFPNVCRFVNGM
jgi:hypothetical protein